MLSFIITISIISSVFGQQCNGVLKETSNTCCLAECVNPSTGEAQCGGVGCGTFLSHLDEQHVDGISATWGCCVNNIRWRSRSELCENVNGEAPCIMEEQTKLISNRFLISWDPHFITPDGKHYDYQGVGIYWLVKTEDFEVQANLHKLSEDSSASWLNNIAFKFNNNIVKIIGNDDDSIKVYYNDEIITTNQYIINDNKYIRITSYSRNVYVLDYFFNNKKYYYINLFFVQRDNKWVAKFDMRFDEYYLNNVSGLIGNWDNDRNNDFIKSDGISTSDVVEFGDSWKVNYADSFFKFTELDPHEDETNVLNDNEIDDQVLKDAIKACGFIEDDDLLFQDCVYDYVSEGSDILDIYALCPNDCSDNGVCTSGECVCFDDYNGDDCSKQPSEDKWYIKILKKWWWILVIIFFSSIILCCILRNCHCDCGYNKNPEKEPEPIELEPGMEIV